MDIVALELNLLISWRQGSAHDFVTPLLDTPSHISPSVLSEVTTSHLDRLDLPLPP